MKPLLSTIVAIALAISATAQTKKVRINHIALSVTDLKKSSAFYHDMVGLDTIPEPFHDGRHVWFSIGDYSHLHLIQNPGPATVPGKNTHLCFSVANVNVLVGVLKKAGLPFEDWPGTPSAITTRVDGVHQIYFKDPDGYWVEINDDK